MKRFLLCLFALAVVVAGSQAGPFKRLQERREARKAEVAGDTITVKDAKPVVVTTEKTYRLSGTKATVTPATTKGASSACPNCK